MKKITALCLTFIMCVFACATSALAVDAGEKRVTMGADLTAEQRSAIYAYFGIEPGTVQEIIVTNADERKYLEGLVPEGKIGHVALSCIYITALEAGAGLQIETNNINWCSADMYANALTTAGIRDAKVMVSAPFPVSGTAALTGAYRAYESMTGQELSDLAKTVGVEELITTGQLAEFIGTDEAAKLIGELKNILDQTQNMTDAEVKNEIRNIATNYGYTLTDGQIDQVLKLCRSLEKLDVNQLKDKIVSLTETMTTANKVQQTVTQITQTVTSFFEKVGDFFKNLFGGK